MFADERHTKIIEMLNESSSVTVSDLMSIFDVSIETIRRDLLYLENKNLLKRVHGGAVSINKIRKFNELPKRMSEHRDLKRQLALKAAELVEENDTIAIDSGSTAFEFSSVIKDKFNRLTVIINSPDLFQVLQSNEGITIVMIGGVYQKTERVFYGHMAESNIREWHVTKSFIFPSSVSLKNGVTINISEMYAIQRAYMDIADQVVIMADSTKYETTSPIRLCNIEEDYIYVTDPQLNDDIYKMYQKNRINIIK